MSMMLSLLDQAMEEQLLHLDLLELGSQYVYQKGAGKSGVSSNSFRGKVLEQLLIFTAGEYPTGTIDALKQLHVSGNFAPGIFTGTSVEEGDPTGLYHLIVGEGQNAFVGNGKYLTLLQPFFSDTVFYSRDKSLFTTQDLIQWSHFKFGDNLDS